MLSLFAAAALVGFAPQDDPKGRLIVTRQDLAEVVQGVDEIISKGLLLPATEEHSALAETNLAFDAVTMTFFRMDLGGALGELEALRNALFGGEIPPHPLRVDVLIDDVWVKNPTGSKDQADGAFRHRLRATRAIDSLRATTAGWLVEDVQANLVPGDRESHHSRVEGRFDDGGRLVPLEFDLAAHYRTPDLSLSPLPGNADASVDVPATFHVKIAGAALREDLTKRLDAIASPQLAGAVRVLRQRLKLRWEAPSQENSAEFTLDPTAYEADLSREIAQLEESKDPYLGLAGDHWRTFAHGRRNLPARVLGKPIGADEPLPLVIAFHGAGGDENFMFELAGDGYIKFLARQHGCVVVCPRTADYMFSPKPFRSLIAGIQASYSIDPDRIFVLGHSMGGMATSGLCRDAPDVIAKACCIAGFTAHKFDPSLPIHVISGRLDRIVPFAGVEAGARRAKEEGATIRFDALDDQGHTLLLPAALDLAFQEFFGE